MGKRWRFHPHDAQRISHLEKAAGIPPVVAQLLICRGVVDPQRARDFLEANLNRSVSRAELCAASGAKLRTLHHSFEHKYGVSPIAYHRYRRLSQAREQLKRADPARCTVAQAAP